MRNNFYLNSVGQTINNNHVTTPDADINALETWSITKGSSEIKVAVIDEGVTSNHPDLTNTRQIRLPNSNFAAPYDGTDANDPSPIGNDNHGNACAGIIGATHNNEGIAGIAPNCKIIPIRIPFGYIPANVYADAIEFAKNNGADIISNSWGYNVSDTKLYPIIVEAIEDASIYGRNNKGCIVTFAAGNTANRVGGSNGFITFPANCSNKIIAVGASDRNNQVANYSPNGNELSVVAPSHKAYKTQISGEDLEVWSIDIPGNSGYNPENGVHLPNSGTNYLAYTGKFGGTSAACPQVAGVAALVLSVNPELTSIQVKNIIEQTAKKIGNYSYNNSSAHPNGPWNNQVGYGLVDAYAAVRASLDVDLYTRDNSSDSGTEPLVNILDGFNDSPDIWLRREPDGGTTHQLGRQGEENYVYIRVHNRGENTSFGSDVVKLYIKRAGIGTNVWNEDWTMIGETFIPQIPSGESVVVRIDAEFPTYNNFEWSQNLPDVSYALLTRIESDFDDVTYTEFENTGMNVIQNNNISCKNVVMTNAVLLDDVITDVAIAGINNSTDEMLFTSLKFSSPINEYGNPLSSEAEIRIIFPIELVELWESFDEIGLEHINDTTFRVIEDNAMLENICIPKKYDGLVKIQINFLTEEYSEKDKFEYVVEQYVPGSEELQNRLTILVDKNQRDKLFKAEGGEDVIVKENTIITLSAEDIGENAVYNWYNTSGKFVDRGQNISVTALGAEKYTLEVIAKADGYKDYDSVYVVTTLGKIESISPNPANEQAIVTYDLSSSVSNAYIAIINYSGVLVYNSEIDVFATTHTLNLQNLVAGQYNVRLVSATGEVMDTKTLIVQ